MAEGRLSIGKELIIGNPILNCGEDEHVYPAGSSIDGNPMVKEMDFFAADNNSSKEKVCADDGVVHDLELNVSLYLHQLSGFFFCFFFSSWFSVFFGFFFLLDSSKS